jgi:hypothetical protein
MWAHGWLSRQAPELRLSNTWLMPPMPEKGMKSGPPPGRKRIRSTSVSSRQAVHKSWSTPAPRVGGAGDHQCCGSRVRIRLFAGGKRIRTCGPFGVVTRSEPLRPRAETHVGVGRPFYRRACRFESGSLQRGVNKLSVLWAYPPCTYSKASPVADWRAQFNPLPSNGQSITNPTLCSTARARLA